METLFWLGIPPLHLKRASPFCTERSPTLLFTTAKHIPLINTQRTLKLQVEAKGFGGDSVTVFENKRSQRDNNGEDDDDNDTIPKVIFKRMMVRILFFVGSLMGIGLAMLQVFDELNEQQVWDVPLWLPFLMASLAFGTSGVGLAYGTLSTSWDPEKKGSLLGWEEAQQKWPELWKEEREKDRE
ncbi:uncharacterized protein PAM68-like [Telopea speciosissima]|uniref:uncharacterized protein PAM68-like n=1 Tax=Telopea speciosissima TaxID=54955 RepID=UPI001CC5B3B5|nr:uncharacterized protein PAM68-like [Telopea speciosissima]